MADEDDNSGAWFTSFHSIRQKTIETLYPSDNIDKNGSNQNKDKSPKGSIDEPIQPLVDLINHGLFPQAYATLSSCSGRIVVFEHTSNTTITNIDSKSRKNNSQDIQKRFVSQEYEPQQQQQQNESENNENHYHENHVVDSNIERQEQIDSNDQNDPFEETPVQKQHQPIKKGGTWLLVEHQIIDPQQLVKIFFPEENEDLELDECKRMTNDNNPNDDDDVVDENNYDYDYTNCTIKFEPALLHIAAASLHYGQVLLQLALQCGFRESGLIVTSTRVTVAIRSYSLQMSIPVTNRRRRRRITKNSSIDEIKNSNEMLMMKMLVPPSKDYIHAIGMVANERMKQNWNKLQYLYDTIQTSSLSVLSRKSLVTIDDSCTTDNCPTENVFVPNSISYKTSFAVPPLNLWGHAIVQLESLSRSFLPLYYCVALVLGGYGHGPSTVSKPLSSYTSSQPKNDTLHFSCGNKTAKRSEHVYCLCMNDSSPSSIQQPQYSWEILQILKSSSTSSHNRQKHFFWNNESCFVSVTDNDTEKGNDINDTTTTTTYCTTKTNNNSTIWFGREGLTACQLFPSHCNCSNNTDLLRITQQKLNENDHTNDSRIIIAIFGGRTSPNCPLNDLVLLQVCSSSSNVTGSSTNSCDNNIIDESNSIKNKRLFGQFYKPTDVRGTIPSARYGHTMTKLYDHHNDTNNNSSTNQHQPQMFLTVGGQGANNMLVQDSIYMLSLLTDVSTTNATTTSITTSTTTTSPVADTTTSNTDNNCHYYYFLWEPIIFPNDTIDELSLCRFHHCAVLLDTDTVYIFGGITSTHDTNTNTTAPATIRKNNTNNDLIDDLAQLFAPIETPTHNSLYSDKDHRSIPTTADRTSTTNGSFVIQMKTYNSRTVNEDLTVTSNIVQRRSNSNNDNDRNCTHPSYNDYVCKVTPVIDGLSSSSNNLVLGSILRSRFGHAACVVTPIPSSLSSSLLSTTSVIDNNNVFILVSGGVTLPNVLSNSIHFEQTYDVDDPFICFQITKKTKKTIRYDEEDKSDSIVDDENVYWETNLPNSWNISSREGGTTTFSTALGPLVHHTCLCLPRNNKSSSSHSRSSNNNKDATASTSCTNEVPSSTQSSPASNDLDNDNNDNSNNNNNNNNIATIEVQMIGGGVPGFAFGPMYANSVCVKLSWKNLATTTTTVTTAEAAAPTPTNTNGLATAKRISINIDHDNNNTTGRRIQTTTKTNIIMDQTKDTTVKTYVVYVTPNNARRIKLIFEQFHLFHKMYRMIKVVICLKNGLTNDNDDEFIQITHPPTTTISTSEGTITQDSKEEGNDDMNNNNNQELIAVPVTEHCWSLVDRYHHHAYKELPQQQQQEIIRHHPQQVPESNDVDSENHRSSINQWILLIVGFGKRQLPFSTATFARGPHHHHHQHK